VTAVSHQNSEVIQSIRGNLELRRSQLFRAAEESGSTL